MDNDTFILLYKAMVRPHLEYANSVWCPGPPGIPVLKTQNSPPAKEKIPENSRSVKCLILHALTQWHSN